MVETPQVELASQGAETPVPENYAFVMNVSHLEGATNYTLAPGHELRRATSDEIAFIKDTLKRWGPSSTLAFTPYSLWESRWPVRGRAEALPEAERRYFVIAFRGSNVTIEELRSAFDIAPLELEVGFTIMYHGLGGAASPGVVWHPGRLFHVLEHAHFNDSFFVAVSTSEIDELRAIHSQRQKHDNRLVDIQRLAMQFSELKGLPHHSPLRFLGYFGILESLLTHTPKPSDPYETITRQVKRKVALLDNRWPRRLDYAPFGGTSPDSIWSKMYAYRSQIAHGGSLDLTADLKVLGSHEVALTLIKDTAKAVIRQALFEPQLLADLREC
jgi:hypothetical protein